MQPSPVYVLKDIKKATADVEKQSQNSATFASEIVDDNLGKKPTAAALTQAHKAAKQAQAICEGMINKLPEPLEAMRSIRSRAKFSVVPCRGGIQNTRRRRKERARLGGGRGGGRRR